MTKYPQGRFSVEYGTQTIEFELLRSDRETMAIDVHPDTSVVVDAPVASDFDAIIDRVRKKAKWITKQQRLYAQNATTNARIPQYRSGETHYYLGKQYRLKVVEDNITRVKFYRGRLYMYVSPTADYDLKQLLLTTWFKTRARYVFTDQLDRCYPLVEPFGIAYPNLKIRDMKSKWGSASPSGNITLNLKLIQVPKKLIRYVILHELCHLKEMNHGSRFYALLSQVLPNWSKLRDDLNSLEYV